MSFMNWLWRRTVNTESYTIAKITLIWGTKQTEKFNIACDLKGQQREIESKMKKNSKGDAARSALSPLSIGSMWQKIDLFFWSSIFLLWNDESAGDVT